ncbi:MAG: Dihydroorotase [Elusimicrobia bacterium]|nr:Dihydroorotase [Elusimicrobiota bacterium]
MTNNLLKPHIGKILIKGGRVIDPRQNIDRITNILIENGRIHSIGDHLNTAPSTPTVDAKGKVVAPGLVDVHVHLREPGGEAKETIATGTRAAAAGGVTSVVSMPNTNPPMDNVSDIQFVIGRAAQEGSARVYPTGTISKEREGQEMSEIGAMVRVGCVAITDDGNGVMNAQLLRRALEYTKTFGIPVMEHCEDHQLSAGGVMNEGSLATRLGLQGIPRQAEYVMAARDIALAELTGGMLHLTHISTKETVELVRQAKSKGLKVTADVTPHHLVLTEDAVAEYMANAKVNPPLRTMGDIKSLRQALKEGVIDCIATDHAPHTQADKAQEFNNAPPGLIGLETSLPLILTELVKTGVLTLSDMILRMSDVPARIFNLPAGSLESGVAADLVIFDPEAKQTFTHFASRSQNSPFLGWQLFGVVERTLVGGQTVFERSVSSAKPHPSPL